jgi:predicted O-methyltransferase YrrM
MADGDYSIQAAADRAASERRLKPTFRARLSRIRAMLLTALGSPHGFFTQYAYAKHLEPVSEPYAEIEALCAAAPIRDFIEEIGRHSNVFETFGANETDPVLGRGMFSTLDGMAAYTAVRKFKPKRIVEIGSGDSTYFLAQGVRDNRLGNVTCIDPYPRRSILDLGVNFQQRLMSTADVDMISSLEPNEILFIDSSHIMLPGMDIDIIFNRVFPRLKSGVIVHLHDIFLPDDYPASWRVRNYSEQNALMGWLLSGFFEIIWPGQYALTRYPELVKACAQRSVDDGAGSLWLRRT